ncbi:MAG: transposase [Mycobacterium sp.]
MAVLDRHDLTDEEWVRLALSLPSMAPRRGGGWADHRMVVNGILWRVRTGAPWRVRHDGDLSFAECITPPNSGLSFRAARPGGRSPKRREARAAWAGDGLTVRCSGLHIQATAYGRC